MTLQAHADFGYFRPRFPERRAPFEFYPTPPAAIRALLSVEAFAGDIWEPACGDGAISCELVRAGYDVIATDITDWGYGHPGYDFLQLDKPFARNIVTNPPYGFGLADRFVSKALAFTARTGGRVAMLLNIASLCHPKRHESFVRQPPAVIYALDECVCFPLGDPARATAHTLKHRYAWVIWDHAHAGDTALRWLSTSPFTAHA
ncbi:hypothetical protein K9U40_13765 [Xanthobacter autotrophicus]|uniref:hypothetical protein n=1 Tax=Xanthobacter TaxID=279 RepID=UPI0024AB8DF0|nr:hypothetical protein [Xanthobacter autotrophicus]MDI4665387.1 hypothetical protein [Xanthobacter autotrophicus]